MADDIKVPGLKKPVPKWAAGAGVAAVGVGIIWYYRSHSGSAASAAAGTAAAGSGAAVPVSGTQGDLYPWDGTYDDPSDPYSMDTTTGITYGDEGSFGGVTSSSSGSGGGSGAVGTSGLAGPPFSNNSEWSAYVIAQLEANDPTLSTTAVQNAVGAYLNGQELSSAGRTIVFDALAVGGDPPAAGPGGYPPAVKGDGSKGGAGTKGITLNQPHAISNAQAQDLWQAGRTDVYWRANDGSYVATKTSKGVGQLYTGAQGWAYLAAKKKK